MNRILFRGIKTFWKTKSSLELVILEFSEHNIFEIIAFDPVLQAAFLLNVPALSGVRT